MKLLELDLRNVDGVRDGAYRFGRGDDAAPLVTVLGPPRSGRTRFVRTLAAIKDAIGPYRGAPSAPLRPRVEAERLVARLRCAQGDAAAPLDRVLEATVDRQENAPDLRDHDPRLAQRLSTFDVGHPTPKLWLFDETTGWPLCPGPALRRVPSAREVGASALSGTPTKQSYLRAFLEELLRRDAEDLAAELHQHGAVVGESATTRRARLDAALDALGAGIQLRGVQRDGSLVFHGGGDTRELTDLSSTERRAVLVAATAIHVDLSHAIVIADGLVDGPDAARWVSALRSLCPHGQLVVTATRPGPWMDDGVVIELGARG